MTPARVTVKDIQVATCAAFGITMLDLLGPRRPQNLAQHRQLAVKVARDLTGLSSPQIGRTFGGRDHSTVLFACQRAAARIATDQTWAAKEIILLNAIPAATAARLAKVEEYSHIELVRRIP
jgi:chromosomal replication initiator protein